MSEDILVYADWTSLEAPSLMGILHSEMLRGKEIFSFEYDRNWLESPGFNYIDPDLQLFAGRQYVQEGKTLFGVFTDSCPDRWGRTLLKRREAILAKSEKRPQKALQESDFLLGIQDISRMGALRFKTDPNGPFLADNSDRQVPVWTNLRELEQAALGIDSGNNDTEKEAEWVRMLVQPGSSLGGVRPKASVQDLNGNLWIAKFPSTRDSINTGAWEMVVHRLAQGCGLRVPEAMCERLSRQGMTFLTKRFDRDAENRRIMFLSAMTVLGAVDGHNADDGASYLDIASVIRQYGSKPKEDLLELWKRIVFSISVTNTDDHLRNHGFTLDSKGLRLSPMFDVNPNPDGTGLNLNIDESDNSLDFGLAIASAPYFDIRREEAEKIVKKMNSVVSSWRFHAENLGIPKSEIALMEHCFKV